ncbi:MAG: hypothetical protein FI703_06675 [SAR202 cluster bacterium]|nr:hypothetical protein [SAR202 cluster bacterium]
MSGPDQEIGKSVGRHPLGALPRRRAEALEHQDFAIGEFKEMKMQPSLEWTLRHRDILKA